LAPARVNEVQAQVIAMPSWSEFQSSAPEFATAARRLFRGSDGVSIGFLATSGPDGTPHIATVCPIFAGSDLYLSAVGSTPKVRDLIANPAYSLHAFLGPNDEELQLRGVVTEVVDSSELDSVHKAIPFGSFDRAHPVFRLFIRHCLWVHWERAGQPDTKAIRRRWSYDSRAD
jgi:hypothetical protein